ncbi:MAG: thiol-disulfide oxidoreductase DCC family protein [Bacteroidetes Order II. Incertae sedis bacterium]|nr:thiol-disulfide oxidoreductase DCC family protein [Bacteroidetes Order II. bacterium]
MKRPAMSLPDAPLILFDGVCNLCNASIQFIIDRDRKGLFRFASLQSDLGFSLRKSFDLASEEVDSVILIMEGRAFTHSDAALTIAKYLDGAWPMLFGLIVLPRFIRDGIYRFIARNRYKWFGKREHCRIPTPELRARFLG